MPHRQETDQAMMPGHEHRVTITKGPLALEGILSLPPGSSGVVVFAHGSGSGRFSPRNNFVARHLQTYKLVELLTGVAVGERGLDGTYPLDTVFGHAAQRLEEMAQAIAQWSEGEEKPENHIITEP